LTGKCYSSFYTCRYCPYFPTYLFYQNKYYKCNLRACDQSGNQWNRSKYKNNSAASGGRATGVFDALATNFHLSIIQNFNGTDNYFLAGDVGTIINVTSGMVYNDPMTVSRTASNLITAYQDGVSIGTNTGTNTAGTLSTRAIYVGARNGSGTPEFFVNNTLQFYALHEGLTSGEVIALHTAINNLMTALGR